MPGTFQSIVINAPIETVWNTVKDFHDFSWATGVIESCDKVGDQHGTEIGAKRILNGAFHETLIEFDAGNNQIRYSIDDGPSPVSASEVSNYFGTLKLTTVNLDDTTFVEWSSKWDSNSEDAVEFCHQIYVALLKTLQAKFAA